MDSTRISSSDRNARSVRQWTDPRCIQCEVVIGNGFSFSMVDAINYFTGPETFLVFFSEDSLRKFYVRDKDNNINDYLAHTGPNEQDLMDFYIYDVDRLLHVTGNK